METNKEIICILNSEYETMFSNDINANLNELGKRSIETKDEETLKQVRWEFDLLNVPLGYGITDKWGYYLKKANLAPFSNLPFCEWKKDAVDYYKQRYAETANELSKARYSFAIMTFSTGSDRFEWMKKSVDGWLKTAEKYIKDGRYQEFYEIPPFAYEFALMLSLSFKQGELAKTVFESLHKSILKLIDDGERRWHLDLLEIESKYVDRIKDIDEIKRESAEKLRNTIAKLEADNGQVDKHFLRHHIEILLRYGLDDAYSLNKQIAESYTKEAELKGVPLIQSSFYTDATKKYKSMESLFPEKQEEIKAKIDDAILKLKDTNQKIIYKEIRTEFTITKDYVYKYISLLKSRGNIFEALLDDNSLFPDYQKVLTSTSESKAQNPLQFILPIVVYNKDGMPIASFSSEDDKFNYYVRKSILLGIKMNELMLTKTLEELENELGIKTLEEVVSLLKADELKDIYPTLSRGYNHIFDTNDYISGLHTLVPYFEEIIRRIIQKSGKVDLVLENQKTKFFRGIDLGGLLIDDQVKELIGEDFQRSLKVLLIDNDQANLRNDLLHGRMKSGQIKKEEAIFVSYCLLKLIKILRDIKVTS